VYRLSGLNATNRPSLLMSQPSVSSSTCAPLRFTLTRVVVPACVS